MLFFEYFKIGCMYLDFKKLSERYEVGLCWLPFSAPWHQLLHSLQWKNCKKLKKSWAELSWGNTNVDYPQSCGVTYWDERIGPLVDHISFEYFKIGCMYLDNFLKSESMKWGYVRYHFPHCYINYHILCNVKATKKLKKKAKLRWCNTNYISDTKQATLLKPFKLGLKHWSGHE